MPLPLKIVVRLALCVAATWLMWQWLGLFAVLFCSPLFGVALARPIMDVVEASHRGTRTAALAPLQGRHYEHRGWRMDVACDDDGHPWLLTADARKVVTGLPRDDVLQRQFADRVGAIEPGEPVRIRIDALLEYLRKSTDAPSLKFKVWLEREVLYPARRRQGGVR